MLKNPNFFDCEISEIVSVCDQQESAGTQVMLRKAFFLGESLGSSPNPGLLGHGSKIPDRTIETHTPMDL
jgi:hypothetical protein